MRKGVRIWAAWEVYITLRQIGADEGPVVMRTALPPDKENKKDHMLCPVHDNFLPYPHPRVAPYGLRERRIRMDTMRRAAEDSPIHIGQIIRREMARQQRTVTWLARQIPCDRRSVYHIFSRKTLDSGLLLKLSLLLHTDFFSPYSAYLPNTQALTTPPPQTAISCADSRRGELPCAA